MDDLGVLLIAVLLTIGAAPHILVGARFVRRSGRSPGRATAYRIGVGAVLLLGGISLALDLAGARRGIRSLVTVPDPGALAAWTVVASALCLAIRAVSRRIGSDPVPAELLPRNRRELALLLGGAAVEEYVFRGYLLTLMVSLFVRAPLIPSALVTITFALLHGPRVEPAVRHLAIGAALALPVLATGSLVPSLVARLVLEGVSLMPRHRSLSG